MFTFNYVHGFQTLVCPTELQGKPWDNCCTFPSFSHSKALKPIPHLLVFRVEFKRLQLCYNVVLNNKQRSSIKPRSVCCLNSTRCLCCSVPTAVSFMFKLMVLNTTRVSGCLNTSQLLFIQLVHLQSVVRSQAKTVAHDVKIEPPHIGATENMPTSQNQPH